MAQIKKLSGKDCLYYKRGHCTKPPNTLPGEEQICIIITARKNMGYKTLDRLRRLERFGLTIHDRDGWIAQRYIVSKNLNEMAKISCKNFIESGLNYSPCIHQVQSRCLLKLESCLGRCPDYRLGRKKTDVPGTRL